MHARNRYIALLGGIATAALLTGCAVTDTPVEERPLTVGTTLEFETLDPACTAAPGDLQVIRQVYPQLLAALPGSDQLELDLAESAEFTGPNEFTVVLKPGLTFANENELTAADVAFSIQRQLEIAHESGRSQLLGNLVSVTTAEDDLTVVFNLKTAGDQAFPVVLATTVGAIVDQHTFPEDACADNGDIVAGAGFAGQYILAPLRPDEPLRFEANDVYAGALGQVRSDVVLLSSIPDAAELLREVEGGNLDVALDGLEPADLSTLSDGAQVEVLEGPSGELQSLVFDFAAQPFGTASTEPNATKAQAVRQAVASLVNRQELAEALDGAFLPLQSFVPDGITGSDDVLESTWGDGRGGPDRTGASELLTVAGVATPVKLELHFAEGHFGAGSDEIFKLLEQQLEASRLFDVTVASAPMPGYDEARAEHKYQAYQFAWSPGAPLALAYLAPLLGPESVLGNDSGNVELQALVAALATAEDDEASEALIEQIQAADALHLSSLPLLQGVRVVVTGAGITGVSVDSPLGLRFASISKA